MAWLALGGSVPTIEKEISFYLHVQSAGQANVQFAGETIAGKYREMEISSVEQCG